MNKLKKCCGCKVEKPRSQFYTDNGRKDRKQSWCKKCIRKWGKEYRKRFEGKIRKYQREYQKKWYQKNKKRLRKAFKANYEKNKEAYKIRNKKTYFRRYGITYDGAIEVWEKQGKKCLICKKALEILGNNNKHGFCIDHDHKTGKFRGILCHNCNSAIGMLQENIELVRATVKYLELTQQ